MLILFLGHKPDDTTESVHGSKQLEDATSNQLHAST